MLDAHNLNTSDNSKRSSAYRYGILPHHPLFSPVIRASPLSRRSHLLCVPGVPSDACQLKPSLSPREHLRQLGTFIRLKMGQVTAPSLILPSHKIFCAVAEVALCVFLDFPLMLVNSNLSFSQRSLISASLTSSTVVCLSLLCVV